MLPDSDMNFSVTTNNIKLTSSRVFTAITVSKKYQEILQESERDGSCLITCQHINTGIKLTLLFQKEVNTKFTYFIRYARRVVGFRSLYRVFRYFLKQGGILTDNNHNMIIYLSLIFYLQVHLGSLLHPSLTHRGKTENMLLSDLFTGFLEQISQGSILLSPSTLKGFTFYRYAKSVESKLDVHFDFESKESERVFKVELGRVCHKANRKAVRQQRDGAPPVQQHAGVQGEHRGPFVLQLPAHHTGNAELDVLFVAGEEREGEREESDIL